jgi:hypothetical protein
MGARDGCKPQVRGAAKNPLNPRGKIACGIGPRPPPSPENHPAILRTSEKGGSWQCTRRSNE